MELFGNVRTVSWGPGSAKTVFGQVAFISSGGLTRARRWRGCEAAGNLSPLPHPFLAFCVPVSPQSQILAPQ